MKYYLILLTMTLLGQATVMAIATYKWQLQNENINYRASLLKYVQKQVPVWVLVVIVTVSLMIIMSDYMDMSLTRAELIAKGRLTRFENIQANFRLYTFGWGIFAELIILLAFKGAKNAIVGYAGKKGIDTSDSNKLP